MPQLHGNTTGLSPSATRTLERIYRRRVPIDTIATPELVRSLASASAETGRQVGALVHRSGQVDSVVVGDAGRLMLPDIGRLRAAQGRFRGVRLVHTHLHGEPVTHDDLVDLVRLRLDLVAAVQLAPGGEIRGVSWAHMAPVARAGDRPTREHGPVPPGRLEVDFGALIASLEAEFARHQRALPAPPRDGRAILVHVAEKAPGAAERAVDRLRELRELARTAGVEVVETIVQLRERVDPKFVLGRGKLDDVIVRAMELDAQVLVFDRDLGPSQAAAIGGHTDLKVLDRTQLILDIFAQRAHQADGKLQVELAQLKYSLPRLALKDDSLSRLTGGIGGRGPGETKLEIGRRRAKERVTHLENQLARLARQRAQRRRRRERLDVPVVSIVGYTNAGKSTLLNTLTDSDVLVEDKLFATLDTRSRRLRFPHEREVVLTDTVGFIRDLPKDLFAAFRATFEEAARADLLVHVVDAADPAHDEHIETTVRLLGELGLSSVPRLLVFNKADLIGPGEGEALLRRHPGALLVSAPERESTRELLARAAEILSDRWERSAPVGLATAAAPGDDGRDADGATTAVDEITTLAEMLAAAGRLAPRR